MRDPLQRELCETGVIISELNTDIALFRLKDRLLYCV